MPSLAQMPQPQIPGNKNGMHKKFDTASKNLTQAARVATIATWFSEVCCSQLSGGIMEQWEVVVVDVVAVVIIRFLLF